jgi:hypothetical protein
MSDEGFRAFGCAALSVIIALVAGLIWFNTTPGSDRGDCWYRSNSTGNTSTGDCSFTDRGAGGDVSFAALAVSLIYLTFFYGAAVAQVARRENMPRTTRLKRLAIYLVLLAIVLYVAYQARANYLDGLVSTPKLPS